MENNIENDEVVKGLVKQIIGKQGLLEVLPKSVYGADDAQDIQKLKQTLSKEIRSLQDLLLERCKELQEEK
ncbi:MAG: hypothetical protein GY861_25880 [bacterium]|nr:hypothetical protein [bacterium]